MNTRSSVLALLSLFSAPGLLSCQSPRVCVPGQRVYCEGNDLHWMDSCGNLGEVKQACACGCTADHTACANCACTPKCIGKCCGDDGCGGTCPSSNCQATDQTCDSGTCTCQGICHPLTCEGLSRECGPAEDGCGKALECGLCPAGNDCQNGRCVRPSLPNAPYNLTAVAASNSQINLNWTDAASDETGFKIERRQGTSGSFAQITTAGVNVTSFSDNGLAATTRYFYRVCATSGNGDSSYSNEADDTTEAGPVDPPPGADWTQEGRDAARTSYTAEDPQLPWTFVWSWNGPDASGGTGGHIYNAPREARTITGGAHIYAPAGANGLYALRKTNGSQAWQATQSTFNATPAYVSGYVYAGGANGTLYKYDAASGAVSASYSAGSPLNTAVLLAGSYAYVVSDDGRLHKVNTANMSQVWVYTGDSAAATPPSYSASRDIVIYCTDDAYVHAVNNGDGSRKWRVKPSPNTPGSPASVDNRFEGYWPAVADQAGVVFVRLRLNHDAGLWSTPSGLNKYPNTNEAIRSFLTSNPNLKNLFALNLDDGSEKFVPAVGYGGTEDTVNGGPYLTTGSLPVIKTLPGGKQIAYVFWRNGDTYEPTYDARWDSHMGEMVFDNSTVWNYSAGDMRFVAFVKNFVITDEQCPLSMASNTLFHAHWGAGESAAILDRSDARGNTRANAITVRRNPTIIRRQQQSGSPNTSTHWTTSGLTLYNDGRYWDGPGWWVYWNVLDPPTPDARAYSEGLLPRYTYAADGLVVVEGNGGDLMVFRHSGT